jgi:hypothetical protein
MTSPQLWKQLFAANTGKSGLTVLRLLPESKFNVFAAVDKSSGHRFLLLKANLNQDRLMQVLPSGRGFNVRYITNPADQESQNCLQFELTDAAHADIFDVIANDILRHIQQSHDNKAAFAAFLQRISEWQTFLDHLPASGLGETSQQGLLAELWFLRDFLLPNLPAIKAVSSWAGPIGLAKDFQFPGFAFEVKTTSANQHSRFTVSNEMQLDNCGVGRVFLFGLLLERLVAGGHSLSEVVASIRETLAKSPEAAARFSELLLQSGYIDSDASRYTTRYAIRSHGFYEVRGAFPRIIKNDLRAGVGEVKYSILVSECERYAVNDAEIKAILGGVSV